MKPGPVTKTDNGNKTTSDNYDVIPIFPIYGQFWVIRKLDSGCIVCKPFTLQKLKTEVKNLWHSSHTIALSKGIILAKKRCFVAKKNKSWHQQN